MVTHPIGVLGTPEQAADAGRGIKIRETQHTKSREAVNEDRMVVIGLA